MWNDGVGRYPTLDRTTGSTTTITNAHHEVHDGDHFFIEGHTELDTAATLYVKLVTPNTTKWAHFTWEISSNGILETKLYEGSSGGMAGGAGVTPLNNNRNSTKTSGLDITSGVAVATTLGTLISNKKVGGTQFKGSFGGDSVRSDELILKQNTTYLRTFLSSSDDNFISFKATWYEHTNRA